MKEERWSDIFAKIANRHYSFQIICRFTESNEYLFEVEFLVKKIRAVLYHLGLNTVGKDKEYANDNETELTVIVLLKEGSCIAQVWPADRIVVFDFLLNKPGKGEHVLAMLCRFFELELEAACLRVSEHIVVDLTKDIE